ncbi:MAG: hypothetical protein WBA10_12340 [Elainellaceae cyanobacterium]
MTIQYPSLPLVQEAAKLAIAQHLAADQPAVRLPSPMEAEPYIPTLIEPSPAPGCAYLRHIIIGSPEVVRHALRALPSLARTSACTCCSTSRDACGPR